MDGRPPGNTRCCKLCFSFTGQLTHFSKLQHSCVLLYPFNLIAASFCLWTSLWLLSAFGVTKRQLSLFVLSFLLQGAIGQAFFGNYVGDGTLLDFKFKFQEFNDKTNSQVQVFWCWWLVKNYLQVNKSNIQLFPRTFFGTWNRTRDSSAQKKFKWNNHKGNEQIFIIYLLFFLGMGLSVFFIIPKLGPDLLFPQGASPHHRPHSFLPFFTNLSIWPHDDPLLPTEFSLNPIKHTPSMRIQLLQDL